MSAVQPVALYAARVPPGGVLVPAVPNAAAMFRVTMAAIDPDALPEFEDEASSNKAPRATLKLVRPPPGLDFDDEDSEDDEDYLDMDDDDDLSDEEENGGPSDPSKAKLAKKAAQLLEEEDDDDEGSDEEMDLKAAISKLIKGKGRATDDDSSEGSDDLELDEVVICTLDPEKHHQQTLDFVVAENERVFFKVTGTHTVFLTGNYVAPLEDDDEDDESDEDDYDEGYLDLPDEEEEFNLMMQEDDEESDELDELENPRLMEIDSDEEAEAPSKASKKDGKGKKRPAEQDEDLDDMMAKSMKPVTNGDAPLSKKQQKKLKKNNGEAVEVIQKPAEAKQSPASAKSDRKVQFAKNLEQGPTGSQQKKEGSKADSTQITVREVQGVKIEDRKTGKGPVAKKGDKVAMRYIGKLENGSVFDSNKKGKPFSFKVGAGEVIKGWDIGIPGMAVGAERRVIVPPHLAYGKKALPGIPANSKLIFDVKLLEIK